MSGRQSGYRRVAGYLEDGAIALGTLSALGDVTMTAGKSLDASAAGSRVKLDGAAGVAAPPLTFGNDLDTGYYRIAANQSGVGGNGLLGLQIGAGFAAANGFLQATSLYLFETTDPTAVADGSILYSKDVAGKTQLTVRFPTGVVQQIKIEV